MNYSNFANFLGDKGPGGIWAYEPNMNFLINKLIFYRNPLACVSLFTIPFGIYNRLIMLVRNFQLYPS